MNLNLFMALFWLLVGLGLVIFHWTRPDQDFLRMRWTDWSPGWLIIILALWNLIRWWSARAAEKDRRFEEDMIYQRQRKRYDTIGMGEDSGPNPEFDFTKPAPKEGEGPSGAEPPK